MASTSVHAYHLVAATGYANSGTPKTGPGLERNSLFGSGSGYTAHLRLEVDRPHVFWGPSFLFWNNLTGAPTSGSKVNYFQIELGGRISYRMTAEPDLYAGVGVGYSFSQGSYRERYFGGYEYTFDGDFPTASIHVGAKTDARQNGVGVLAELSYHWGLDEPAGRQTIGPANAYLVQIGVFFDSMAQLR
ncbi:MAG: hypothetical protein KDB65_02625 [Calditrichaeota bacterium]|nr:hypothetical protein [Calditrichota bacterium]